MNRRTAKDTWTASLLLTACFFAPIAPVAADEPEPVVLTSDFGGKVYGTDGQPAAGFEILTYHLATAELFTASTDVKGEFTLEDLPYGYFDMAVRSSDGLYVADQVARVSVTGRNFVELRLQLLGSSAQADLRAFAGANEAPMGLALLTDQRMAGPSFWTSPKGISTLAGGGVAVLVLLSGGGSDPPASPFGP